MTISPNAITLSEDEVLIVIAQRIIIKFLTNEHTKATDILQKLNGISYFVVGVKKCKIQPILSAFVSLFLKTSDSPCVKIGSINNRAYRIEISKIASHIGKVRAI